MNEINIYIGGQIRKYRKANGMTLQQLADVIHKSRATVCKYENGEISIDIATLYEISQALQVSFGQLTSYQPTLPAVPAAHGGDAAAGARFFRLSGCISIFMTAAITV